MKALFGIGILVVVLLVGGMMYVAREDETPAEVPALETPAPPSDVAPVSPSLDVPVSSAPRTHTVVLRDFAFVPGSLTIATGDVVTWMNEDSASHTVTSDSGKELRSSLFGRGESYTHTFTTPGIYPYHCGPHGTMKGTIEVR
jgi:plastocyanin